MDKPLNIAFIVNEFPCISETFILNQIIGLLNKGHRVHIFAYKNNSDNQKHHDAVSEYDLMNKTRYFPALPQKRIERLCKLANICARQFFKYPKQIMKCLNIRKYGLYEAVNHLFRMEPLMNEHYDVIHCQYGPIGQDLVFLKEVIDVKIFTSFRGYDLTRVVHENHPSVYEHLFKNGDKFLPVCQYFADKLEELNCPGNRIDVLYSGINLEKYQYQERQFDFQKKL